MMTDLEPIEPQEALDWYLDDRAEELADSSLYAHKNRLGHFIRWCSGDGDIENLNDLSGRDFSRYKIWRREDGDLNNVSLNTQLHTLRVFIQWCEGINAVQKDYHEYIDPPRMSPKENVRSVMLEPETAAEVLAYLEKFRYATRHHVVLELLWETGMRSGAVRSIDLDDLDYEEGFIEIHHRPETDTPLKNGEMGERHVPLKPKTVTILRDYVNEHRQNKTDSHGREPLLATRQGRLSKAGLRANIYSLTRPCVYGNGCPHDKDPETCEAATSHNSASKCPSTVHPHAIRKGRITWARLNDVPVEAISYTMDVSPDILEKHYDMRNKKERMEAVRNHFDTL